MTGVYCSRWALKFSLESSSTKARSPTSHSLARAYLGCVLRSRRLYVWTRLGRPSLKIGAGDRALHSVNPVTACVML